MDRIISFLSDSNGNKSSGRLCFVFMHLLVAVTLVYCINQHFMTDDIRDVILGMLGIGWTGKVTQAYKELTTNANTAN